MEIFEANLLELEKKYPYLTAKIKAINIDKIAEKVSVEKAANEMSILTVEKDGRKWRLNSKWNPQTASEIYGERYAARLYQIYFVFGFSDGRCVRQLLKKCDDTNYIVVCEPDLEIFYMACCEFELQDLIREKRILFYLPEIEIDTDRMLRELLDYSRTKLVEFCILPGYDVLYREICESFMDSIIERIRNEVVHKSTRLSFNRMVPQDTLFHMKNLIYHRNITQLREALAAYDLSDIPAIIVSAGPSLDKNAAMLKEAQGKAFIMVVDAAIRTVLRVGVRPDIICTIDPESPDRFFEGLNLEGTYWSCTRLTRPEVVKNYAKDIFYHGFFYRSWNEHLGKELGYPFPDFISGGSVSAEAFILAMYLGFTKIILVGQDMAFTNGISHTKGIEGAFGDNDEYIQSRYRIEVEGIDGTMLETDFQMWYYKQWFEKMIRLKKDDISVINATEGGAKIVGAPNRRLEDVIVNECKKELDIYGIERQIPNAFSEKQQTELRMELKKIKEQTLQFDKRIEKMITEQENILKMVGEKGVSPKKLAQKLREVQEQNMAIAKEAILDFIAMYAQKEEYEVGDQIYTQEDMTPMELVEKSLILLKGYQKGTKLLEEDIEEFIMKE